MNREQWLLYLNALTDIDKNSELNEEKTHTSANDFFSAIIFQHFCVFFSSILYCPVPSLGNHLGIFSLCRSNSFWLLVKRLCDCGCCCQLSPSFSLINNIINFEQFSFMRFCCTSTHTHTIRDIGIIERTHDSVSVRRHSRRLFRRIVQYLWGFGNYHILYGSRTQAKSFISNYTLSQFSLFLARSLVLSKHFEIDAMFNVSTSHRASNCQQYSKRLSQITHTSIYRAWCDRLAPKEDTHERENTHRTPAI